MGDGIYTALTGAMAQEHTLDVVANNVANASTAGFRGDKVVFGQLLAGAQKNPNIDPRQPAPGVTDKFVRVEESPVDQTNGYLRSTGNPLDLALGGEGFFTVRTPSGDRLTRAGKCMLKDAGNMTTALATVDGNYMLDDRGEIIVFPRDVKDIQVIEDGTVRVDGYDYARLGIRTVTDGKQLIRAGTTMFSVEPGTKLIEPESIDIRQGHLEASNSNPMGGMFQLITINRTFDALQRVIQTFQQMDQRTARDIGSRTG
jgi:flagellar basal-body rod protein FlgF